MTDQYQEPLSASEPFRRLYAESIDRAVGILREAAAQQRMHCVTPEAMAENREAFRRRYASLLGLDVCESVFGRGTPLCQVSDVGEDSLCMIQRLKIEIAPEVYFTGLLLLPKKREEKAPLVLMSHGGGGSPELCADLLGNNNYGGMVRKMLNAGCIVFAPQLLLWNLAPSLCDSPIPTYATPYNRIASDVSLKQCGTGIAGFEIYCFSRSLDLLLCRQDVDPQRCGMMGLSYGGFYTLHTMAYDTRIRSGWAAAFFNDRLRYNWPDYVWMGAAQHFLDPEVVGLCAPRRLVCDVGRDDGVFRSDNVEKLFPYAEAFYEACGSGADLRMNLWDGGHKFCPESLTFFLEGFTGE